VARAVLDDFGLAGWPKTSGSRGIHILVRIETRWAFDEVRRCALALAREIERRAPKLATSKWWKEERRGVFVDYNQNAKDRTVCSAYSVRPRPDARVSAPLTWDELATCDPADFTLKSMPARFARAGDPHEGIDDIAHSLDRLAELASRQEHEGAADAPWPPYHRKR
jgi:bifunctional non-homologous end joining protein LigD